jgi:predicted dithiol-disulfide oxidoreductase (DUF899 family)
MKRLKSKTNGSQANPATRHEVVLETSWLEQRKELLKKEKAFTRQRDELSRQRRELPWVKVEKPYVFDTPAGKQTLADLFDGRSQLIVYYFMLGPGWNEGCKSCSFLVDHIDGALAHLEHHDVSLVVVSRAPLPEIAPFKSRMGWRFRWAVRPPRWRHAKSSEQRSSYIRFEHFSSSSRL